MSHKKQNDEKMGWAEVRARVRVSISHIPQKSAKLGLTHIIKNRGYAESCSEIPPRVANRHRGHGCCQCSTLERARSMQTVHPSLSNNRDQEKTQRPQENNSQSNKTNHDPYAHQKSDLGVTNSLRERNQEQLYHSPRPHQRQSISHKTPYRQDRSQQSFPTRHPNREIIAIIPALSRPSGTVRTASQVTRSGYGPGTGNTRGREHRHARELPLSTPFAHWWYADYPEARVSLHPEMSPPLPPLPYNKPRSHRRGDNGGRRWTQSRGWFCFRRG